MNRYKFLFASVLLLFNPIVASPLNSSCTVTNYHDVAAAAKTCSTLTLKNIQIPMDTTMTINLKDGAKLIFDGHLTHVPTTNGWHDVLMTITGNNVEISGTSSHLLDGSGQKYWKGAKSGQRPAFLHISLTKSQVKGLHFKNCPGGAFGIEGSHDVVISDILVDDKDGYPAKAGTNYAKNTDGFGVGSKSTNIRVQNSVIYNQDDCVAINSGSNLVFDNLWCHGSHGLSFTVWDGDVHDITFKNSHLEEATNAIHIKTHPEGHSGTIRNILYHNVTMKDITSYGISIQQNYPSGGEPKANVKITNLTMSDITGTVSEKKGVALQIICAKGGCSDWKWNNVKITGAKHKNICENVPSGIKC